MSLKNDQYQTISPNEGISIYSFVFWLMEVLVFMAADQFTKVWMFHKSDAWLMPGIGKVNFENVNFAFSLPLPGWLMGTVYGIVLLAIAFYLVRNFYRLPAAHKLAWALIVAGAASNVGERIIRGSVRDFIYIFSGIYSAADVFIIIGIVILLLRNKQMISSIDKSDKSDKIEQN